MVPNSLSYSLFPEDKVFINNTLFRFGSDLVISVLYSPGRCLACLRYSMQKKGAGLFNEDYATFFPSTAVFLILKTYFENLFSVNTIAASPKVSIYFFYNVDLRGQLARRCSPSRFRPLLEAQQI